LRNIVVSFFNLLKSLSRLIMTKYCSRLMFVVSLIGVLPLSGNGQSAPFPVDVPVYQSAGQRVEVADAPVYFEPVGRRSKMDASSVEMSLSSAFSPEVRRIFPGNPHPADREANPCVAVSDSGWVVSVSRNSMGIYDNYGGPAMAPVSVDVLLDFLQLDGSCEEAAVLYDPKAKRFILGFMFGKTPATSRLILCYTVHQDPNAGWYVYQYDDLALSDSTWTGKMKLGISDTHLFVAFNQYGVTDALNRTSVLRFSKDRGYDGLNNGYFYWSNLVRGNGQAADNVVPASLRTTAPYGSVFHMLSANPAGGDTLYWYTIEGDNLSRSGIPVVPYAKGTPGNQPGSSTLLDVGDCSIRDAFYADGRIHFVLHEAGGGGLNGFRYGRIDAANSTLQPYGFGIPNTTCAFPSLAPYDAGGGVLVGFLQTSAVQYPGMAMFALDADLNRTQVKWVRQGLADVDAGAGTLAPWSGSTSAVPRFGSPGDPTVWFVGSSTAIDGRLETLIAEIAPSGSGFNLPCQQAQALTCGDQITATTVGGDPQLMPACGGALDTAPGKWFRFLGTGSEVTLSLCNPGTNFQARMAVFTGSCTSLVCTSSASCPSQANLTFTASDGEVYFVYVTGVNQSAGTFQLQFTCADKPPTCGGNQVITSCNGAIEDGSGLGNYSSGLNCSWTIQPSAAQNLTLSFSSFATQDSVDVVRVYDGADANAPLLATYSGRGIPDPVSASSGRMHVVFQTDSFAVDAGWSAVFTCSTGPAPVTNFSASTVCGEGSLTVAFQDLSANAPMSWLWEFGNGATSSAQNPVYTYTSPGVYKVTLTTTNTSGSNTLSRSAYITVIQPLTISAQPAASACAGDTIRLETSGAIAYNWSGPGLLQVFGNPVLVRPESSGTLTISVTGTTNNCTTSPATIDLTFAPRPVVSIAASDTAICLGKPISLTASGASSYVWSGQGLSGTTQPFVFAQLPSPGTYTFTLVGFNGSCTSLPATRTVQVYNVPVISAEPSDAQPCLGDTIQLTASGASQYTWSGPFLLSASGSSVEAVMEQTGALQYAVIGSNPGCSAAPYSVAVEVVVNALLATIVQEGCPGPNLQYKANIIGGGQSNNILWYLNDNPVWAGPVYTYFNAANGNQVYARVLPVNPPVCTRPEVAYSDTLTVSCIPLGSGEPSLSYGLSVSPNPNKGLFYIDLPLPDVQVAEAVITNASGLVVRRIATPATSAGQRMAVDLRSEPPGMYMLTLLSPGKQFTTPFIKQ
jgi:PKD repeat protein